MDEQKKATKRVGRKIPQALSEGEVKKLFDTIRVYGGFRDLLFVELLYYLGLRVSEALKLTKKQIDTQNFVFAFIKGKGDTFAPVTIPNALKKELKTYIELLKEDNLFDFKRENAWHLIKKYCKKAGLPSWVSPHTFRHTHASVMLNKGANLALVKKSLRHTDITITQIYTHIPTDKEKEEIDKIFTRL